MKQRRKVVSLSVLAVVLALFAVPVFAGASGGTQAPPIYSLPDPVGHELNAL